MKRSFLFLLFAAAFNPLQAQTKHFVKQNGVGDGTSWPNASGDLQDIINNATPGDSIFVGGGTYLPNRKADALTVITVGNRDNAFMLKEDVKIYGGFAGTENSLSERNLTLTNNASILTGDLGIAGDNSDNAYHVVISVGDVGTATLNGFTIRDANAASPSGGAISINGITIYHVNGGGIYNQSSSPNLTNLIITGNTASDGGGLFNRLSSVPTLTNVMLSGNVATIQGSAIYIENAADTMFMTNITIAGNLGSGLYCGSAAIALRNSVIYGNTVGLVNLFSTATISNCLIQGSVDTGNGNLGGTIDPLFVAPAAAPGLSDTGDYHLQATSAAINAGSNSYFSAGSLPDLSSVTTDIGGNMRIQNGTVDMGAYENQMVPLPITLIDFTGRLQHAVASLTWHSGVESNFNHYEVEKSTDGETFTLKANMPAKGSYNNYNVEVAQTDATAYYRLKMIDNSGRITFSKIIALSQQDLNNNEISVYPIPAHHFLIINTAVEVKMDIYNMMGENVKTWQLKSGVNYIETADLAPGVYTGRSNKGTVKFTKE